MAQSVSYITPEYETFRDQWYLEWYYALLPYLTWSESKHQREWNADFLSFSNQEQKDLWNFPKIDTIYLAYIKTLLGSKYDVSPSFFSGECLYADFDDVVNFVAGNPYLYQS